MRGFQLVGGAQEEVDIARRLTRGGGTGGHAWITGQCFWGGTVRKHPGCCERWVAMKGFSWKVSKLYSPILSSGYMDKNVCG